MKFFTKEVKIALTGITAVVLLFIGINFLKGINLFKQTNAYNVRFRDISGLTVSNPVYANGFPVGIVRQIHYDYGTNGFVIVEVELNENMKIPVGTKAELEAEMLGSIKMNLLLGKDPINHLMPGDTIVGGMHEGSIEKVSAMIPQIEKLIPKIDSIVSAINRLTNDPALAATLRNTNEITGNLCQTTEKLNTLMANDVPTLTKRMNHIAANIEVVTDKLKNVDIEGTMKGVNGTLQNVEQFTATLNSKINSRDNSLGLLLNDRSMYDNINHTVISADSLLTNLKSHPKRYVHFSIFGKKDK